MCSCMKLILTFNPRRGCLLVHKEQMALTFFPPTVCTGVHHLYQCAASTLSTHLLPWICRECMSVRGGGGEERGDGGREELEKERDWGRERV